MVKKVTLMADYQCYPIWLGEEGNVQNTNPAILPLMQETIEQLEKWAKTYDSTLNLENPNLSGFLSQEELEQFDQQGIFLWKRLKKELNEEYKTTYFSLTKQKELSTLEEYNC